MPAIVPKTFSHSDQRLSRMASAQLAFSRWGNALNTRSVKPLSAIGSRCSAKKLAISASSLDIYCLFFSILFIFHFFNLSTFPLDLGSLHA